MTDQKFVDELEKALRDEAYDGGFGHMGDEQFTAYVRTLAEAAAEVFEKALTPTDSKPVAYGIYGRATGNLRYVQVMDAHEVEERSEFYDVVPLFAIPAAHGQTVGGNEREALAINYCPEHGDLLNRPGDGADARSYRCRNAHGIDEIHAGFRHAEEPETAPELFPGTLDALDSLTIRKEEA